LHIAKGKGGVSLTTVTHVDQGSPACGRIEPGEQLATINGHPIRDVLDYQYHSYDENLLLNLRKPSGQWKMVRIRKEPGEDLGLTFSTYLMAQKRACVNRCVFCFIDQLPPGLRETLYFKDDDVRLSFLTGNYVSLTNLTEAEIERIIAFRVSPLNISVHATDPAVRAMMFGNPRAGRGLELMRRFADAGLRLNAQIVVCPGLNDGEVLEQTMRDLKALYPQLGSVSVVPVGLTRHRDGLYPLNPVTKPLALEIITQVEAFAAKCRKEHGSRLFFLADELYLRAGVLLPDEEEYEDYPQLENGVGMLRYFKTSLRAAMDDLESPPQPPPFAIATGTAVAPFMQNLLTTIAERYGKIKGSIYAIQNDFFGRSVTVAGLVTGGDILAQLKGKDLGKRLLIPRTMLRHGEDVFLDDMTTEALSAKLGVPVIPVDPEGEAFLHAIFI